MIGSGLLAMLAPARRAAFASGRLIEEANGWLRQWPAAGISLLVLAILVMAPW
jgi:hypothetical protein